MWFYLGLGEKLNISLSEHRKKIVKNQGYSQ